MSFRRLLIHRATVNNVVADDGTNKDAYGRPKAAAQTNFDVPCRLDDLTSSRTNDEKGVDYIEKYSLFCFKDSGLAERSTVENIRDRSGNLVAEGKFVVEKIKPRFRRSRLHHIEAVLKRL